MSSVGRVFLVAGKRTPFGKFGESLKDITPVDLAVLASKSVLEQTGVKAEDIDHVVLGNVIPSTTDTIYGARHIGLKLGAPQKTPAYNINRLCGSGIQAIIDAKNMIQRGEANLVLSTGSENMSMTPHLTYGTRFGTRFNEFKVVDMLMDSLTDAYCKTPMAITAENLAEKYSISREECDKFSVSSHQKASEAYKNNYLQGEIVPVTLKKSVVEKDEHIREGASLPDMQKLRSVFKKDGTVTAASASGIVDGAGAVLIASEEYCNKHNLQPIAEIGESTVIGVDPNLMGIGPSPAISMLLQKTGKKLSDIDLIEINEAFAAQTLSCAKDLSIPLERLNIWGGAIAIGHPLGASGIRITNTLARQLKETNQKTGIASACIGGGQGISLMLHSVTMEFFVQVLGERKELLDNDSLEYACNMIEEGADEEDLLEMLSSMFEDSLQIEEEEALNLAQSIIKSKFGNEEEMEEEVFLEKPVVMAAIETEQNAQIEKILSRELKAAGNFNDWQIKTNQETWTDMSVEELQQRILNTKKMIRTDKRGLSREKKQAIQRDEIIRKISNRPIKLHSRGEYESSRLKDIRLEEVQMSLGDLVLGEDLTLHFADGRKYGLVGANGIGKTTFLKFLSAHAFPGIPPHLQILHIEQEVEGSDQTVLETVLQCDIEREDLLKEVAEIQDFMDTPANFQRRKSDYEKLKQSKNVSPFELEKADEFSLLNMTQDQLGQRMSDCFDRMTEIETDTAPGRAASILVGLGYTPEMQQEPTNNFSGGWRMRISLAQALFIEPDILLLDEPTNHLDLHAVVWLEEYLERWDSMLITVSHDRDFLNSICTDIVYMHDRRMDLYRGNFDSYLKQKAEKIKNQNKLAEAQAKERAHIEHFIIQNKVNANTAKMAQSRVKKLQRMEFVNPEIVSNPNFQITIPEPDRLDGALVQLVDVSFGYNDEPPLWENVDVSIDMETRVALVGPNGVGKSTLLKMIMNEIEPKTGLVKVNPKLRIGRFTQHHMDQLDLSKSPLAWFQDMYPLAKHQEIRKHLGGMGIQGDLALRPIYSLSGGQKSRVAFAHITWIRPHVLLLDEPTNHLDMETIDSLIVALNNFEGGVFVVSHDEHLITTVCDRVWIVGDQKVTISKGDFYDYKANLSASALKPIKIKN